MSNPWPKSNTPIPAGADPAAVAKVRAAYKVDAFTFASWLGVTVTELQECEQSGTWPRSDKARTRLMEMAKVEKVVIVPEPKEEAGLF